MGWLWDRGCLRRGCCCVAPWWGKGGSASVCCWDKHRRCLLPTSLILGVPSLFQWTLGRFGSSHLHPTGEGLLAGLCPAPHSTHIQAVLSKASNNLWSSKPVSGCRPWRGHPDVRLGVMQPLGVAAALHPCRASLGWVFWEVALQTVGVQCDKSQEPHCTGGKRQGTSNQRDVGRYLHRAPHTGKGLG